MKGVSGYNNHAPDNLSENEAYAAIKLPKDVTRSGSSTSYAASPVIFFVDEAGYLRCFFSNGGSPTKSSDNGPRSSVSYVYFKWDRDDVKEEQLQSALGIFNADLEKISPSSRVSAVRFSSSEVKDDAASLQKLVMLDWTKDPAAATKMLSLEYGDGSSTASEPSTPSAENENSSFSPIEQYNYGLTGGTSTYQGLKAFRDILLPRMKRDIDERNNGRDQYVIVFTDGKDTNVEDLKSTDEDKQKAANKKVTDSKNIAAELKSQGFTIFYVLLKAGSFKEIDSEEKDFIASIAGNSGTEDYDYDDLLNGTSADEHKYVFEAASAAELNSVFRNDILNEIAKNLEGYTVQDYIDPRFDLIGYTKDSGGNPVKTVYRLEANGKVEYTDAKDGFKNATVTETDYLEFTPYNGSEGATAAKLYYKAGVAGEPGNYYLAWENQNIPYCTVGDSELSVWRSEFDLAAKEDFIGGNAILFM